MANCLTEGCKHKIRHNPSGKSHHSSWKLFGICPCCAKELFPHGFIPPRGITIKFFVSANCIALTKQENEELVIIERRKNVISTQI